MLGRMGGSKRIFSKLKIVKIDNDLPAVMIKGPIPGKPGSLLHITPSKIFGRTYQQTSFMYCDLFDFGSASLQVVNSV